MRGSTIVGLILLFALALAACAPAATATEAPAGLPTAASTISVPVTGDTETPFAPAASDTLGTSTVEAALATSTSEPGTSPDMTGAGVTIRTSTSPNVSEPFLVDQQGRALYLFTTDVQNSGTSACTAECLTQWPPVVVTGTPQAGEGVDASRLGTITREDGTLQATYNGWPLYTYAGDAAPGDITGQGMGGAWFLVSGTGNSIQP